MEGLIGGWIRQMAKNTCCERAFVRMFIPCGPELRTDERSGARDVQRQHRYHLLDCVDFGARYQWTAVALVALWTAASVQPNLSADAVVGLCQHAERHDEDGHTVPAGQTVLCILCYLY